MASHISLTDLDGDLVIVDKNRIISCEIYEEDEYEEREVEDEWLVPDLTESVYVGTISYTAIKLHGQSNIIRVKETVQEVMNKIQA